jgi:hypothetical protein
LKEQDMKVLNMRWRIKHEEDLLINFDCRRDGGFDLSNLVRKRSGTHPCGLSARLPRGRELETSSAPGEGNIGSFSHMEQAGRCGPGSRRMFVDGNRGMYEAEPNQVSQHFVEEVLGAPKPLWYVELRYSDKYWTFMVSKTERDS